MPAVRDRLRVEETNIGHRPSWQRFLWDQIVLRSAIGRQGVDLLLSSSDFGLFFPPCRQILMVRSPLFFSQTYLEKILPTKSRRFKLEFLARRWLISLSVRSSDIVATASQSMLRDVRKFIAIPDGKIVVNPFGVPLDMFRGDARGGHQGRGNDAGNANGRPFRLLFVSEYSDYKNLTTLLKAVLFLRERGKNDFYLISTADPGQFQGVEITSRKEDGALASHPLVASSVRFTGSVPYEDMPGLYEESDLFVFPSLVESFAHPLVEAMANGLPIAASDIPICREVCGEAAAYFSPLDPADLAQKILMLWSDQGLRQRLGQVGRDRAEAHFDWRDHVRRMVKIMETAASRSHGE
jgi:glycosyltransferase involved in cell wall biosynthesis